jgi:hypothetical protein
MVIIALNDTVNAQIIQDHDLSCVQARSEHLLNVDLKSRSIGGSIQHKRFSHALHRQGSDQRHGGTIAGNSSWNAAKLQKMKY